MVNLKPTIYQALAPITEHVYDQYPQGDDWDYPVIIYADEHNVPETFTSDGERQSMLRFRVEIHSGYGKTTDLGIAVNVAMTSLGLRRIFNQETNDPAGRKIRTIRFEGIYDQELDRMYHR